MSNVKKIILAVKHCNDRSGGMSAVPLDKRALLTTITAAVAISYQLPLPSSPLEGTPRLYYVNNVLGQVKQTIDAVNEEVVVNYDQVLSKVYDFWLRRYNLVHNPVAAFHAFITKDDVGCEKDYDYDQAVHWIGVTLDG